MRIELYDGKYTYVCNDDGSDQHALRYGERWRDLVGDGFVLAMAQKIEEQQERIKELELDRKYLIEEFAEAECMGDLAKTARNHGYKGGGL